MRRYESVEMEAWQRRKTQDKSKEEGSEHPRPVSLAAEGTHELESKCTRTEFHTPNATLCVGQQPSFDPSACYRPHRHLF